MTSNREGQPLNGFVCDFDGTSLLRVFRNVDTRCRNHRKIVQFSDVNRERQTIDEASEVSRRDEQLVVVSLIGVAGRFKVWSHFEAQRTGDLINFEQRSIIPAENRVRY